jgi:hypothetical protein
MSLNLRGSHVEIHFHKQECVHDGFTITETKVLHSNAGYYIGHEYYDEEMQMWCPYDRITGYYPTRQEADDAMDICRQVMSDEEV